ncbi:MAG: hypothetical protein IH798_05140 [Gemmatimonadetes bacterium]|nr:hypothetical protein [Gemmatimonadota bacterium]
MLAVGFLALDGALLLMAGIWLRRIGLVAWGVVFALGAVAVFFYWRRYQQHLREINEGLESRFRELMELQADHGKSDGRDE